ncbi:RNA-binding protein [Candidatus Dependentiae bacterium]|nr:RNA-binding protein [Candidatus Dependentiae bacterium]
MNIYVGNLIHSATEEAVRQLFEGFGAVVAVRIIKDRFTGQSRGFAFVDMANADDATAAISQLNGYDFEGRRLRVSQAEERDASQPRPQGAGRPSHGGNRGPRPFNGGGDRRGNGDRNGGSRGGFSRF